MSEKKGSFLGRIKFVKFSGASGVDVHVIPSAVSYVKLAERVDAATCIGLVGGDQLLVKESVEVAVNMLSGW